MAENATIMLPIH